MSHIQSQVLGAPLICGGRLEGAMVKWIVKNLDWMVTMLVKKMYLYLQWTSSLTALVTGCGPNPLSARHVYTPPWRFFLYLTEFTRFWIGLGKYSSFFCETVNPYHMSCDFVDGEDASIALQSLVVALSLPLDCWLGASALHPAIDRDEDANDHED